MRGVIWEVLKNSKFWKFGSELHFHRKNSSVVADAMTRFFFWRVAPESCS